MTRKKQAVAVQVGTAAVILIDMQERFLKSIPLHVQEHMITHQIKIFKICAVHDLPLIVLEIQGKHDDYEPTIPCLQEQFANIPRVEVLKKQHDDGFRKTYLEKILKKLGVSTLILMGINKSYCVLETSVTAIEIGYRVITTADLIADSATPPTPKVVSWYKHHNIIVDAFEFIPNGNSP